MFKDTLFKLSNFNLSIYVNKDANEDIQAGDYRPINLEVPPFQLPEPQVFIGEAYWREDDLGRGMGLWTYEEILSAASTW